MHWLLLASPAQLSTLGEVAASLQWPRFIVSVDSVLLIAQSAPLRQGLQLEVDGVTATLSRKKPAAQMEQDASPGRLHVRSSHATHAAAPLE